MIAVLAKALAQLHPSTTTYTVAFNSDGGSAVPRQRVPAGGKATEPTAPTKAGYTFDEWQLGGETYDFSAVVTANITLTATWDKDE